jgi:hypothetical protein
MPRTPRPQPAISPLATGGGNRWACGRLELCFSHSLNHISLTPLCAECSAILGPLHPSLAKQVHTGLPLSLLQESLVGNFEPSSCPLHAHTHTHTHTHTISYSKVPGSVRYKGPLLATTLNSSWSPYLL